MNRITNKLLTACRKAGYRRVAIGVEHPSVPHSVNWCFGPKNSVFAWPDKRNGYGYPAIWDIIEQLDIGGGAGNIQQHAIRSDAGLEEGCYEFSNGKWIKGDA